MGLSFLADPRNWWSLTSLIRKEIHTLVPFKDLYLLPSANAAAEKEPVFRSQPLPAFWCGRPEIGPAAETVRVPLGEGDYTWLEVVLEGVAGIPDLKQRIPFLTKVIELVVEKAFWITAQQKDPETGCLNQSVFYREVLDRLRTTRRQGLLFPPHRYLGRPETESDLPPGLGLLTLEPLQPADPRDQAAVERERVWLRSLGRALENEMPWPATVGRVGSDRYSILWEGVDETAVRERTAGIREVLRRMGLRGGFSKEETPLSLIGGFAVYPEHFSPTEIGLIGTRPDSEEETPSLQRKADLALRLSREREAGREWFGFSEVLRTGGKVEALRPMNRLIVNLGDTHLASLPMFFGVSGNGRRESAFKAVVSLNEVFSESSLGEVSWIRDPLDPIQPGDSLTLLPEIPPLDGLGWGAEERSAARVRFDPDTGLLTLSSFLQEFQEETGAEDRFWLALIRFPELGAQRDLLGRPAIQQLINRLVQSCLDQFPRPARLARYSFDTLIILKPGDGDREARLEAERLKSRIQNEFGLKINIGIADFPRHPFQKSDAWENAMKALSHSTLLGPGSIALLDDLSLHLSGDRHFDQGNIEEAILEYTRGLEINPANPNLRNSLGVCYGNLGRWDAARTEFVQVLRNDPGDFMAHYNLGLIGLKSDDRETAREHFEQARALNSDHFDVHYQLGKIYRDAGRLDESLESFSRAQQLRPDKTFIHRYLGEAWLKKGDWDQALAAFKGAVKNNPRDVYSLNQLGALYLQKGNNHAVALSLCRYCVDTEPGNPQFRYWLGRAFFQNRDYRGALGEFQQAQELGDSTGQVRYYQGLAHESLGQPAEARRCWEQALALDPGLEAARRKLTQSAVDSREQMG